MRSCHPHVKRRKPIEPRPKATLLLLLLTTIVTTSASHPNLYQTLGVPRNATPAQIKKAYRKLALQHHPDKSPPSERSKAEHKFKEIGKAYEWLSDETKRGMYDRYGERSLEANFQPGLFEGAGGGGTTTFPSAGGGNFGFPGMFGMGGPGSTGEFGHVDIHDILRQMMGGVPMSGASTMGDESYFTSRGEENGASRYSSFGSNRRTQQQQQHTKAKEVERPIYCSLDEMYAGCTKKLKVSFLSYPEKIYTVHIRPGWKEGTKIKFSASQSMNEFGMNNNAEYPPITFVLHQKKHPFLRRVGDDLHWRCKLTASQAERGSKLKLPLPDGSVLEVSSAKGIMSGARMTVRGRGMPMKNGERGNVVIDFIVTD